MTEVSGCRVDHGSLCRGRFLRNRHCLVESGRRSLAHAGKGRDAGGQAGWTRAGSGSNRLWTSGKFDKWYCKGD